MYRKVNVKQQGEKEAGWGHARFGSASVARTIKPFRFCRVGLMVGIGLVSGCESLSYYVQAAGGQWEILQKRQPISAVLADSTEPEALLGKLRYLREAREFASRTLKLPDNKSYTQYVDLGRPYVVWNVVATDRYSVAPRKSCFPVAGCVSYRGFFKQSDAERHADSLRKEGLDVRVGGVSAYSTLGWFADPVLNTMLRRKPADVAGLLFHELAHQVLYKKGDTTFSESFATTVEREGLKAWLVSRGEQGEWQSIIERRAQADAVISLILRHRASLGDAYQGVKSEYEAGAEREQQLAAVKRAGFAALRNDYEALKAAGGGTEGFDFWMQQPLNNASLALFADYHGRVEEFTKIRANASDWEAFYDEMAALADRETVAERVGVD